MQLALPELEMQGMAGVQPALTPRDGSGSLNTALVRVRDGLAELWAPAHLAGAHLVHGFSRWNCNSIPAPEGWHGPAVQW